MAAPPGTVLGTIKSYNKEKGFGFITRETVEGDIYFAKGELPAQLQLIEDSKQVTGRTVSFELRQQADGKCKAARIAIFPPVPGGQPLPPLTNPNKNLPETCADFRMGKCYRGDTCKFSHVMPGTISATATSDQTGAPGLVPGQNLSGVVKRYNGKTGYGFIGVHGWTEEVYFSKRDVPPYLQEQELDNVTVQFAVYVETDGKKKARSLDFGGIVPGTLESDLVKTEFASFQSFTAPSTGSESGTTATDSATKPDTELALAIPAVGTSMAASSTAQVAVASPMMGQPILVPQPMLAGGIMGQAMVAPPVAAPTLLPAGPTMTGVLKSYNNDYGYGFLNCAEYPGSDIFFKQKFDRSIDKGRQATFCVQCSTDGAAVAVKVTLPATDGETTLGHVKSFSEKNGYGFLNAPGIKEDIYFPKDSLPSEYQSGVHLTNRSVRFTLHVKADGKPQARSLEFVGGTKRPGESNEDGHSAKIQKVDQAVAAAIPGMLGAVQQPGLPPGMQMVMPPSLPPGVQIVMPPSLPPGVQMPPGMQIVMPPGMQPGMLSMPPPGLQMAMQPGGVMPGMMPGAFPGIDPAMMGLPMVAMAPPPVISPT